MRLFIAFLIVTFVIGGTTWGERLRRQPAPLFFFAAFVGALFYSYRFLR